MIEGVEQPLGDASDEARAATPSGLSRFASSCQHRIAIADDFDNMHHAFGRPRSPNVDCYRNYFATDVDGVTAQRFETLGWWDLCRVDGTMAFYSVNGAGKQALTEWMAANSYEYGRWVPRAASGIETEGGNEVPSPSDESPTGEAGDAQGVSHD